MLKGRRNSTIVAVIFYLEAIGCVGLNASIHKVQLWKRN